VLSILNITLMTLVGPIVEREHLEDANLAIAIID
jgi:hypothetical protein